MQRLHTHFTSIHRTPEAWALTRPCLRLLWFLLKKKTPPVTIR